MVSLSNRPPRIPPPDPRRYLVPPVPPAQPVPLPPPSPSLHSSPVQPVFPVQPFTSWQPRAPRPWGPSIFEVLPEDFTDFERILASRHHFPLPTAEATPPNPMKLVQPSPLRPTGPPGQSHPPGEEWWRTSSSTEQVAGIFRPPTAPPSPPPRPPRPLHFLLSSPPSNSGFSPATSTVGSGSTRHEATPELIPDNKSNDMPDDITDSRYQTPDSDGVDPDVDIPSDESEAERLQIEEVENMVAFRASPPAHVRQSDREALNLLRLRYQRRTGDRDRGSNQTRTAERRGGFGQQQHESHGEFLAGNRRQEMTQGRIPGSNGGHYRAEHEEDGEASQEGHSQGPQNAATGPFGGVLLNPTRHPVRERGRRRKRRRVANKPGGDGDSSSSEEDNSSSESDRSSSSSSSSRNSSTEKGSGSGRKDGDGEGGASATRAVRPSSPRPGPSQPPARGRFRPSTGTGLETIGEEGEDREGIGHGQAGDSGEGSAANAEGGSSNKRKRRVYHEHGRLKGGQASSSEGNTPAEGVRRPTFQPLRARPTTSPEAVTSPSRAGTDTAINTTLETPTRSQGSSQVIGDAQAQGREPTREGANSQGESNGRGVQWSGRTYVHFCTSAAPRQHDRGTSLRIPASPSPDDPVTTSRATVRHSFRPANRASSSRPPSPGGQRQI
ncbi:hypothetical protein B0T14DRAFT_517764 [Immersiella caudata]|uniref:Uncharacterized protein n=1 Tax=Immersiella caudata TaxID=314043 RepID=A0AA39WZV1_9PEZI|nr:hypothetical protein B0T14DRAFT_517764 [Immersiella caudata]